MQRRSPIILAVALLALAAPSAASAAQRWASPGGTATTTCAEADPCKLADAIEGAVDGDEVVVKPGDHTLAPGTNLIDDVKSISIVGQEGQARPTIQAPDGPQGTFEATLYMRDGVLRNLEFVAAREDDSVIAVQDGFLRAEQLVMRGTAPNQFLIRLSSADGSNVIESSYLAVDGEDSRAISIDSGTADVTIRNTTALATGTTAVPARAALYLDAEDDTSHATVRNSLLRGDDEDIDARTDSQGPSTVDIDYSAYHPAPVEGTINAGSHNLTADSPLAELIDTSGHLVAGSPLINAGTALSPSWPFDFDGQPRTRGAAPDIGADEALTPDVLTGAAGGVSTNGAGVQGSVRPNGLPTTYRFEYGTSTTYGSSTPERSAGNGSAFVDAAEALASLAPGTTYHYRLVATNQAGTSAGADAVFTTATPPVAEPDNPKQPTAGADTIDGSPLGDFICGLAGNDTIRGLGGNDTLFGDACNDKQKALSGARVTDGNDVLSGGEGNDVLYGAGGKDRLSGGGGRDKLVGGNGNDSLTGGAGNDTLDGGRGRDKLNGGPATNSYKGGAGNDSIDAANRRKETVDCGSGKKDTARVDRRDRVKGCEKVRRT